MSASFNIHTGYGDIGDTIDVSEIDGLEKIVSADGSISFSGAILKDVDFISPIGMETHNLKADLATIGSAVFDAIRSAVANIDVITSATATLGVITSTTMTVADLFVTNTMNLRTLIVNEFYADIARITKLTVDGDFSVMGDTYLNRDVQVTRDVIIGGTLKAHNIITFSGNVQLDGTTGEYVWRHYELKPPVVHYASFHTNGGGWVGLVTLEYSDEVSATFRFYKHSFIGFESIGGTLLVNFIAIGS
jgi:hypothetical protein